MYNKTHIKRALYVLKILTGILILIVSITYLTITGRIKWRYNDIDTLIKHFPTTFNNLNRIISSSEDIILNQNMNGSKKTLYVTFYMNVIPVDQGGGVMEYDWIVNVLLGKINRPIKILKADEKHRRNDTLHVYLFQPEKNIFVKSNGLVNQGAYHMGDELMKNNIELVRFYCIFPCNAQHVLPP